MSAIPSERMTDAAANGTNMYSRSPIQRRPSFLAGVGSLLDLSGVNARNEIAYRKIETLPPHQAIESAWLFIGHSLRSVMPLSEENAVDGE